MLEAISSDQFFKLRDYFREFFLTSTKSVDDVHLLIYKCIHIIFHVTLVQASTSFGPDSTLCCRQPSDLVTQVCTSRIKIIKLNKWIVMSLCGLNSVFMKLCIISHTSAKIERTLWMKRLIILSLYYSIPWNEAVKTIRLWKNILRFESIYAYPFS